jgi:type I restriction enzyme M protein
MLTAETKRRLDACRDILVGKLPLPTDQIELITLALIYKFMDDLDEESVKLGGKRSFFVGPLETYRWRALLPQTVSTDERMTLFAEGIEAIGKAEHLPALFRDIFRNSFLKFRDGRILTLFLNEVNGFVYSHSEELGNAFEYLLKTMGIQAENGQFRTPRHVIDFMVACLDPQPNDRILDPACGTGGFLVSCYKHILAKHTSAGSKIPGDKLTHDQRQKVYSNLTGYDVTDLMVKLSKVNLFLHGFPDPAIHIYDTLTNDARWNEKADLILANPPFMTPTGGVSPHTKFRVSAKKSEVLFTDYIAEHLTPDGRGGVIVPNGIVATTQNAYVKLRKFLIEDSLVAVVSLPAGVFRPYSSVKTSILFLDKKLARKIDKIVFLKINADGFDLGDQRRPIAENDLPEVERMLKAWFAGKLSESTTWSVAWKPVEKRELLGERHVVLATERFIGEAGAVSEEHPSTRLGNVADYVRGLTYGKDDESESPTSNVVLRAQNVSLQESRLLLDDLRYLRADFEGPAEKRLRADDILVCTSSGSKAHLGKVAFVLSDVPYFFGGFMAVLRARREIIEPRFLFRLLNSQHHKAFLAGLTEGANINNLKLTEYLEYEIPLPPLEEQRRLVAEIEGYQKVLDGARQILAGYRPQIPKEQEWPTVELRALIHGKPKNGYSGKPVRHPTKLKVLTLSATTSGKMDISQFKYLDEEILKDAPCRCRRGDIYLQRGNTKDLVGTAALFDVDSPDYIYPDLMIRVRADETKILTKFLLHTLQSRPVREYLMRNAGGAAGNMPKINQGIVESIPIPLPPLDEQRQIVAALDAEAAQIEATRSLIPRFEAKVQRVLDRVWGNGVG